MSGVIRPMLGVGVTVMFGVGINCDFVPGLVVYMIWNGNRDAPMAGVVSVGLSPFVSEEAHPAT